MGEHGGAVKLERDRDERSADGSDRTGNGAHPGGMVWDGLRNGARR